MKFKISNNILSKKLNSKLIMANSFHNNIIKDENLGENLNVHLLRTVFDNTIEGIIHKTA